MMCQPAIRSDDVLGKLTLTTGTQGLVFVVDSSDHKRIDEAKTELHRILNDREMSDCLLLVFANKQDIQGGMCSLLFNFTLLSPYQKVQ